MEKINGFPAFSRGKKIKTAFDVDLPYIPIKILFILRKFFPFKLFFDKEGGIVFSSSYGFLSKKD